MRNQRLSLEIATVILAVASGGTAMAQTFPEGSKTGASGLTNTALVTLTIPALVGIDVEHNFVLSVGAAGTGCWGATGAVFPMAVGAGDTNFTFAVKVTAIADTADVACPAAGAGQPDVATVKVFSTAGGSSTLKAKLSDGGFGVTPLKKLTDLVPNIFTKLTLEDAGAQPCGGGTAAKHFPLSLATTDNNVVTLVPATPFSACNQKLQLVLNTDTTAYSAGTATGKLTYTMTTP